MRALHVAFRAWLKNAISHNAEEVVLSLSPTLPGDQLYNLLVPDNIVRTKLRLAAECMPVQDQIIHNNYDMPVRLHDLGIGVWLPFELVLKVPDGWGTILLPALQHRAYLGSNNVLTELLLPSIRMAQQWASLKHCTNFLLNITNDRATVREMFPWIVEAVKESQWATDKHRFYANNGIANNKQEQADCDRTFNEVITIYRGFAPRMTTPVREVCLSGGKLFSQVRMAKSVDEAKFNQKQWRTMDSSSITPVVSDKMVPPSIHQDLQSVKQLYDARKPKRRMSDE